MAEDSAENRNEVSSRFNQWVIADWVNRLTSSGGKCDLIADWIQKPDVRARVQPDGNQSPAGWRPDGENQSLTCNIRIYSPNGTLPDFRRVSKRLWSCFHALTDEFFFFLSNVWFMFSRFSFPDDIYRLEFPKKKKLVRLSTDLLSIVIQPVVCCLLLHYITRHDSDNKWWMLLPPVVFVEVFAEETGAVTGTGQISAERVGFMLRLPVRCHTVKRYSVN